MMNGLWPIATNRRRPKYSCDVYLVSWEIVVERKPGNRSEKTNTLRAAKRFLVSVHRYQVKTTGNAMKSRGIIAWTDSYAPMQSRTEATIALTYEGHLMPLTFTRRFTGTKRVLHLQNWHHWCVLCFAPLNVDFYFGFNLICTLHD